jgi:hypothetical protein
MVQAEEQQPCRGGRCKPWALPKRKTRERKSLLADVDFDTVNFGRDI